MFKTSSSDSIVDGDDGKGVRSEISGARSGALAGGVGGGPATSIEHGVSLKVLESCVDCRRCSSPELVRFGEEVRRLKGSRAAVVGGATGDGGDGDEGQGFPVKMHG